MITYKGQKTVIGKRFIYENEVLKYTGKIYGDSYSFVNNNGTEYILAESDLDNLKEYSLPEEKTNIIGNMDGKEKIKQTLIDYTQKELNLLNDISAGKSNDVNALTELYEKELEELRPLSKYDMSKATLENISLEAQQSFLEELNRNISNKNIVTILVNLQNYIASNKKGGSTDANI